MKERISSRLGIAKLNDMQEAMLALPVPARVLLLAPTGSGKTLAFAIPFLRSLPQPGHGLGGLVIAPTRELVLQTAEVLRVLAAPERKTVALYGGHSVQEEVASLGGNPDIAVATPGRLLDHLRRGHLSVHSVRALVLDEYDKSLELGFHDDMRAIVGRLKNVRTTILTSATQGAGLPDFIDAAGFTTVDFSAEGKPSIEVLRVSSEAPDKIDTLDALLRALQPRKTIVFVNHRDAAERVYGHLDKAVFPVALYHGGMEQSMREQALALFENGSATVMVATDLAARGLDIDSVDAVVHYHLPPTPENWTHRNGRTARMGADGRAYVIVSGADRVPDYIAFDGDFDPRDHASDAVLGPALRTLYFNAGKKDKISRGDIAGFLIAKGGLVAGEVGRIVLKDHGAYVPVPAAKARDVIKALQPHKIKNKRVRVTQVK